MQRQAIAFVYTISTVIFLGSSALATQVVYQSPQQLGQQSTLVVRGRVAAVESYWNANRTKIFTRTLIAVDETYKGSTTGTVEVTQLGGVVDGVRVTVHGAVAWRQDEEVVVFLEPYQADGYHVAGFSQGKFNVERDPDSNRPFIRRPAIEGLELMTTSPSGDLPPRSSEVRRVPIDQFINQALGRK